MTGAGVFGWLAYAGFAFAAAALALFLAVVFFADVFLKSDDQLRRTMDRILWSIILSLACLSFTVAFRH